MLNYTETLNDQLLPNSEELAFVPGISSLSSDSLNLEMELSSRPLMQANHDAETPANIAKRTEAMSERFFAA